MATDIGTAVAATDADAANTLTYSLGGTDAASFDIDTGTGQLKTKVALDHETKPSYDVTVAVADGQGGSDSITVTIAVTDDDTEAPGTPAAPTVTGESSGNVAVAWTAPDNAGPAITDYDLRYREGSSGAFTDFAHAGDATSATITGLNPGTSYEVQVRATNDEGTGPWSASGTRSTSAAAPTVLTATGAADGVALSWTAPARTATVTGYQYRQSTDGGNSWNPDWTDIAGSSATTARHTVTGLTDGDTYTFEVRATNNNGTADAADDIHGAAAQVSGIAGAAPNPPTNLKINDPGGASGSPVRIDFDWVGPTSGPAVTGYQYRYRAQIAADSWSDWSDWADTTYGSDNTDGALPPVGASDLLVTGTNYEFQVRSLAGTIPSVPSNTVIGKTAIAAPTDLTAIGAASATGQVELRWSAPSGTLIGFQYRQSTDDGGSWSPDWTDISGSDGTTTSHRVTGLDDGATYTFEVRAVGGIADSLIYGLEAQVLGTPGGVPSAPTGLSVDTVADDSGTDEKEHQTQLALSWTAGAVMTGVTVSDYAYRQRADGDANWGGWTSTGRATAASTTDPYTVMGLLPNTTYEFQVRAMAGTLASNPTDAVSRQTAAAPAAEQTPPAAPTGLTASAGDRQVTLSWTRPNDPTINGYVYTQSPGDQTEYQISVDPSDARGLTSHTVTGLENGIEYTFTLKAENVYDKKSDPSNTATATPSEQLPTDERVKRIERVTETVVPEDTRARLASTLSAVTGRIEAGASGAAPAAAAVNIGGSSTLYQALKANQRALEEGTLDLQRVLAGSSFTLPLSAVGDGEGGPLSRLAFWGSGDYRNLSGGDTSAVEWEGEVWSAHLGADVRLNEEALAGLALSRSKGTFDYTDHTDGEAMSGDTETRMTNLSPYVGWSTPGGVDLWGTLGYGWGEIEIDDDDADGPETSDLTQTSFAVGGGWLVFSSDALIEGGATTLKLKAQISGARVEVEGAGLIEPLTVDVSQRRVAVEGRHAHALASGGTLTPGIEIAVRNDAGDGETGTGVELGGSLRYQDPETGLTVQGHGRALLTHSGNYEEWGFSGLIRLDPGADDRGLSLSLVPAWGETQSGVQRLWNDGVTDRTAANDNEAQARPRGAARLWLRRVWRHRRADPPIAASR